MRKLAGLVLLMICLIAPVSFAQAESLWVDSSPAANLFADHRAHAVGDVITIIISENSTATRSGDASNQKQTKVNVDAGVGLFTFVEPVSASNSDSFKASGSINNKNTVTGRITVKVTEIQPNGQLVISGTQTIKQNSDTQKITISGIVRSEDVSSDNTVLSSAVADAQLKIEGKGPLSRKQRQGLLTQVFNFVF